MSIETYVEGDPQACRAAARSLGELTSTLEAASVYCAADGGLTETDFDGSGGATYRTQIGSRASGLGEVASDVSGLTIALRVLADGLEEVGEVMSRARAEAGQQLVLHGTEIIKPGPYGDPEQFRAYRQIAANVARVRVEETRLQQQWTNALVDYGCADSSKRATVSPTPGGPDLGGDKDRSWPPRDWPGTRPERPERPERPDNDNGPAPDAGNRGGDPVGQPGTEPGVLRPAATVAAGQVGIHGLMRAYGVLCEAPASTGTGCREEPIDD